MKRCHTLRNRRSGFTLLEFVAGLGIGVLLAVAVLAVATRHLAMVTGAQAYERALTAAQGKVEEIRRHAFAAIAADYGPAGDPGDTFPVDGLDGVGWVTLDMTNPGNVGVKVSVCWRDHGGRVIGEDRNLNGAIDEGEDPGANGVDSPVVLVTYLAEDMVP